MKTNVLILGSGGREHAIAWKLKQSPLLGQLYCAPGNPGTALHAVNLSVDLSDFEEIKRLVLKYDTSMVVVGPEEPLVRGIVDYFSMDKELSHCFVVGPSQAGAQLEGSKDFAKSFMNRHHIPTAAYRSFTVEQINEGITFLKTMSPPYVLKADGLAAGKGVVILSDLNEAAQELRAMLEGKFGAAGNRVVIEEYLSGIELSVFFITDGKSYKLLPNAKDYKRIGDGDTGLNTGGMGAVSPVPFADQTFMKKVEERIVAPTVAGLQKEGIDYKGFVFVGIMNCCGDPYVIEYNVRLGDPETEVVLPRLKNDLLALLLSLSQGKLALEELVVSPEYAITVVIASEGYPQTVQKGYLIEGLDQVQGDAIVFHAGTKCVDKGIVTSGGRVLAVTATGPSLAQALEIAYGSVGLIRFKGVYYRKDIGNDVMKKGELNG
ncbi:MAG: phosphoribosylamine--glycine ligase [Prevotellaceae bacterium]|jgi:phosphoribosylamine--glycine ligase|nr:phosphoribosylamine--glycine ligase [Prevotellaceae bacterium]